MKSATYTITNKMGIHDRQQILQSWSESIRVM